MIETNDLSKDFDGFKAVDGVTLSVQPGQVLALLGQNGAGKTTTVRMLTSILRPSRGWARINGHDVVEQPEQVRSVVGVLAEQHGLYARMTGHEYLDYFGKIYGLDAPTRQRRNTELLEYFGLAEAATRRSGEYSKGMRQKLALARALLHEPPVLILDEPTSAIDPESARLVRDEIARLRSSNRTIVLCSHNLIEVEALADSIAIIYRGKIHINGTPDTLKTSVLGAPQYEVQIAGEWNRAELQIPAGVSLQVDEATCLRYQTSNPESINPQMVAALGRAGAQIVALQEIPRTLEQVYLSVMQRVHAEEKQQ